MCQKLKLQQDWEVNEICAAASAGSRIPTKCGRKVEMASLCKSRNRLASELWPRWSCRARCVGAEDTAGIRQRLQCTSHHCNPYRLQFGWTWRLLPAPKVASPQPAPGAARRAAAAPPPTHRRQESRQVRCEHEKCEMWCACASRLDRIS